MKNFGKPNNNRHLMLFDPVILQPASIFISIKKHVVWVPHQIWSQEKGNLEFSFSEIFTKIRGRCTWRSSRRHFWKN